MNQALYENKHKATKDFPHIEFDSQNLTYISHFHNEIEIAYLAEGYSTVFCDNKKIDASAGDLFIFMPGQIHSFIAPEQNKYYIFKLRCDNEIDMTDFSTVRTTSVPLDRNSILYEKLKANIRDCYTEFYNREQGHAYIINGIANSMVGNILRYGELSHINSKADKKSKFNTALLTKVNSYIEENFNEKIVIADIASYCGLSEYYFAHTFKDITGSTFFNYLTVYRLEKAVDIHIKTKKSLTETAYECGFSNIRSFYRLFKKHFLVTPKEYINKINT